MTTIFKRIELRTTHPQKAYEQGVEAVRDALSEIVSNPAIFRELADALNKARKNNPYKTLDESCHIY